MPPDFAIVSATRSGTRSSVGEREVRGPRGEKLDFELLYSDGVPLDTIQHRLQMNLLIELTDLIMADRGCDDYFVGGDTFLYYSVEQARFMAENAPAEGQLPSPEYRQLMGPDYFFVAGAPWRNGRQVWITWEENNRYPQVIVELTSPSTAKIDRTVKKRRYESRFKTAEYIMYWPGRDRFEAFHLGPRGRYRKAASQPALSRASTVSEQWVWSEQLGVWLGLWKGRYARFKDLWLRFYDANGELIPTTHERAETEKKRADSAEVGKKRAEAEKKRAEAEKKRAEAEKKRAEKRAEAAEAEVERLRALLRRQ